MAILNFPDTTGQPTDGSFTYTENDVIYVWDGAKWTAGVANNLTDTFVNRAGDTMTGDLTVPNLISEGDVTAVNVQTTSLNGGQLAALRNVLLNADFAIAQRGSDGTAGADFEFPSVDRWSTGLGCRLARTNDRTHLCPGFNNGLSFFTAANREWIRQAIELPGAGNPGPFMRDSQWTISIWSTAASVSTQIRFADDRELGNEVIFGSSTMTDTGETRVSSSGAFTYKKFTYSFPVNFDPAATNTCVTVDIITPGASAVMTGVQLEPGPVATPFEHRPIGLELELCKRYFEAVTLARKHPRWNDIFLLYLNRVYRNYTDY